MILEKYAVEKGLIDQKFWIWVKGYARGTEMLQRIYLNLINAKRKARGGKFQFGPLYQNILHIITMDYPQFLYVF